MHRLNPGRPVWRNETGRVVPENRYRSIVRQEFPHLRYGDRIEVAIVLAFMSGIPVIARAALVMPVLGMRVVDAKPDALARARFRHFQDEVTLARRSIERIEGTDRALE